MKILNSYLLHLILLLLPTYISCLPKVLHLTFHKGCEAEIQYICKKFDVQLTTLFIPWLSMDEFDGKTNNNARYNITDNIAKDIWEKHKNYFYEFDLIITSDTAPLARIFLQNDFEKPLIIWVCNRFDYSDAASLTSVFPDPKFYELFREAAYKENVRIISYCPFEHIYAQKYHQVHSWSETIKPVGRYLPKPKNFRSFIPKHIDKANTIFIPPYHNDTNFKAKQILQRMGIACYQGCYNGPHDLAQFKAIVHIPYAWSNLALFENWQNAVIYFIPSKQFFLKLCKQPFYFTPPFNSDLLQYSEWYNPKNSKNFVFFDSWEDLKCKISSTDYQSKRKLIKEFAIHHKKQTLEKWKKTFHSLGIDL